MRIYLVSDIEGSCGFTAHEEGKPQNPLYDYFRRQMGLETASACRGIQRAGGTILVHDAHNTARNIEPTILPKGTELMRCSGGDPYAMLSGVQNGEFDAVVMTGFHSGAGSEGSPVSHTFNHKTSAIYVNGLRLSEFLFNAYSAAYLGLPVPFLSGDSAICAFAKEIIPGITTVEAVKGIGAGTCSRHPDVVCDEIEKKVYAAFSGDWKRCVPKLPDTFTMEIHFHNHVEATFNSYYSGIEKTSECVLRYTNKDWYEVLRMVHFVLDK